MDEKNLMLSIWHKIESCRMWSETLAGAPAKDDLETWLLDYRRRLEARPANVLSDFAADLRSLVAAQHPNRRDPGGSRRR